MHKGKRCFILANGPSIKEEDLIVLKNEICFSVSNFFHHPDYDYIKPKYHVVPRFFDVNISVEKQKEWLNLMNDKLVSETFFLDINNYDLIKNFDLLKDQNLAFLSTGGNTREFDITQMTQGYQTVPIMCLEIAVYMGFSEIYLLGIDIDSFCTDKYEYFFDRQKLGFSDPAVDEKNISVASMIARLETSLNAFNQFERFNQYTNQSNIKIFNLSKKSKLDMFEKKTLQDVISPNNVKDIQ
jgi:hypothetical protein